jgi:hypothetical protein
VLEGAIVAMLFGRSGCGQLTAQRRLDHFAECEPPSAASSPGLLERLVGDREGGALDAKMGVTDVTRPSCAFLDTASGGLAY